MINKRLFQLIILLILFIFSSCREEIIPPNSSISNPNQPVRLLSSSSYTFILNANNVSTTYKDYSGLSGYHSMINISLNDYENGTVIFHIYDGSDHLIFQKAMSDKIDEFSEYIDSGKPNMVQIIFNNFTGNLKITVDNW